MSDWTSEATAVEEHGSVTEEYSFTGEHSASVQLRVPWAKRMNVVNDVLVFAKFYPNVACGAMASKCIIKPTMAKPSSSPTNGRINYQDALVTIHYDTNKISKFDQSSPETGSILYSEEIGLTIDAQKLNPKNFCWGSSALGQRVTDGPVRQMYSMTIKRTLYNMTSVPPAFFTLPGHTNNASYTSTILGVTFATETLLFYPGTVARTITTAGVKAFNVPMTLAYRPDGWNKAWNPDKSGTYSGGYDEMFDEKSNKVHKNFPPADFSSLVF